jgi:hypothetical protein
LARRTPTKFERGTGWPSFTDPLEQAVETTVDRSHFMVRTEVHCLVVMQAQGQLVAFRDPNLGTPPKVGYSETWTTGTIRGGAFIEQAAGC